MDTTYYSQNKEKMKINNKLYKLNNIEKVKETNKIFRSNYNKLNYYCKECKKLLLLSSKKRHDKRKHFIEPKPLTTYVL
tara:strand:- start:182 stop:418 length:237 start_codon:yes stop_codon:yes gene_type:complete